MSPTQNTYFFNELVCTKVIYSLHDFFRSNIKARLATCVFGSMCEQERRGEERRMRRRTKGKKGRGEKREGGKKLEEEGTELNTKFINILLFTLSIKFS